MRSTLIKQSTGRKAVAALFAASALTLTACGGGTAGDEAGADVEDVVEDDVIGDNSAAEPFEGPYDTDFYDEYDSYVGEEVVLSADVNEVITPTSFTIAGTDDTTVDELLIVGATENNELAPEVTVEVTGTVMEAFVLTDAEEELGVDLDDALFEKFEDERYVMAESVEVLENVDPG